MFHPLHFWSEMGAASRAVTLALLAMGLSATTIGFERFLVYLRATRDTARLMKALAPLLDRRALKDARERAASFERAPLAGILVATLDKYQGAEGHLEPGERARREAERQIEAAGASLRRGLAVVATVGSTAPFVGLLGTVVGIITAFQGIAATGSGGLGAVSAGISEALVETALGLLVAIPAVLLFNYLSTRAAAIEAEVTRAMGEVMDELDHGSPQRTSQIVVKAA